MNQQQELGIYEGGCHCGKVRFKVIVDQWKAVKCNCSICRKKGFIHLIVSPEKFTLLKGEEILTTYSFNTHTAKHTFCRICGIHPFYIPRSHPNSFDINLNCLDQDILDRFELELFDGQNWEQNINQIS